MSNEYFYNLPKEKIALYPSDKRSDSKILVYTGEQIYSVLFSAISDILPVNSILIRNNTKVIKSRLFLKRETGATIEVLCINYKEKEKNYVEAECLIKNVSKLKPNEVLSSSVKIENKNYHLQCEFIGKKEDYWIMNFSWTPANIDFILVLDIFGTIPLPPYIKRTSEKIDASRYQTTYAEENGSVAAPTAGLHFTEDIDKKLQQKNIKICNITLHVGYGTFNPLKTGNLYEHKMHSEKFSVNREIIEILVNTPDSPVVCIGTTSLRTLESLYIASHFCEKINFYENISVGQWDATKIRNFLPREKAWQKLLLFIDNSEIKKISGETSLMITPDYRCNTIDYLLTNFHQPNSTLLLIVASIIGKNWKDVYQYALSNDFRFLSYGDACLLKKIF